MEPLGRHPSPRPLSLPDPLEAGAQPAHLRAAQERWLVRNAEHEGRAAVLERWIEQGLAQGGEGTKLVLEAKALAGRTVLLGASGKLEIEKESDGFRVTTQGGLATKGSRSGGAWKAGVENGFTTGRGWHLQTAEGAAWVASLLLQGAAKDTPAELLLPGVPTLGDRLKVLDGQARFATLEFESGAEVKASGLGTKGSAGIGGLTAWVTEGNATRITLDRERGELVLETELKGSTGSGLRELQLGEFLEAGALVEAGSVRAAATWSARYPLTAAQRERAAAGDVAGLLAGLSKRASEGTVAIRLSGQVGGQAFAAKAELSGATAAEAARAWEKLSLGELPVRFARLAPAVGVGAELGVGIAELGMKATLEPHLPEGSAARPLGDWLKVLSAEVNGAKAEALGRLARAASQPE